MFLFFIALAIAPPDTADEILRDNLYVRVEVAAQRPSMKPGEAGEIRFLFMPADGIHVNGKPGVQFRLDSTSAFRLQGTPVQDLDSASGFLMTVGPVLQAFSIAAGTVPGIQTLTGTLVYYYCSDAEGWCMRFTQRVQLPITITK
jgi:hypothetical protein